VTDDIMFGAVDVAADTSDEHRDEFLSVLEAGIRETKRLNERLVLLSAPEKVAWELELRVPSSREYIGSEAGKHAKKRAQIYGVDESAAYAALILARYTVGILHGGDYAVDARAERASAFADPRLLRRLGARDSAEAVLKLFEAPSVVDGLAKRFVEEELSMDDAEVETVEDPSVRG
jgi:hypothetical protein